MTSDPRAKLEAPDALYQCEGNPGSSDWVIWRVGNKSRFNGQFGDLQTRRDSDRAIVRMHPGLSLANVQGRLHGGAVMTFVDMAMFLGAHVFDRPSTAMGGLTVDCSVQFVGGADVERPVDAVVQITRETGRFLFMRGTVEQGGDMVASFMGLLRKASR